MRLHQSGRVDEAETQYRAILAADPNNADAMHLLGVVCLQKQDWQQAQALIENAIQLAPNRSVFHHNLGAVYRVLGRFADAESHYRDAIRLQPDYAEAYFNLSGSRQFTADDVAIAPLCRLAQRSELSPPDRTFVHFALGKIYDDLGNYDQAFSHYEQGNQAAAARYDPADHSQFMDDLIVNFDRDRLLGLYGDGCTDERPVFVVGMPRSGTTLIEQILASHPDVFGAGELMDIPSISRTLTRHTADGAPYPSCIHSLEATTFRGFGEAYIRRVGSLHATARRIVDKYPINYEHLGLIALLLPQAHIIHCRRNALDTCLSCYFQRFRKGHAYAYDLGHLGANYRDYQRIMEHWRDVLPMPMLEMDYEVLVREPENASRQLIDFCGLPWDARCLEFHAVDRPVSTASQWQVRRPIYRSAVARWERYADHLGPLRESLGS